MFSENFRMNNFFMYIFKYVMTKLGRYYSANDIISALHDKQTIEQAACLLY